MSMLIKASNKMASDGRTGQWSQTHGLSSSPAYRSWGGIIQRCNNPKNRGYSYYGGRGIRVCDRWLRFENFLADMGPRPSLDHSVERINTDGHYEPDNCRWATRAEQQRNRRDTRRLTVEGITKSVKDWSEISGISVDTICARIANKWPEHSILTLPPAKTNSVRRTERRHVRGAKGRFSGEQ